MKHYIILLRVKITLHNITGQYKQWRKRIYLLYNINLRNGDIIYS